MVHLDHRDARPIYSQIVDGYRKQIIAGVLQSGDKLPSVRELASQLTINPNTIQRAYRELEAQGWIITEPGKGCFVKSVPNPSGDPLWEAFDSAAAALLAQGITLEELIAHLQKGGNDHAQDD